MTLNKLKEITSLHEFAYLLGIKPKGLSYILYVVNDNNKYTEFEIPKKSGGTRKISAPISQLKDVQLRLAKLLLKCDIEIKKSLNFNHVLSHGFTKNYSILTNAYVHRNRRHVFNVDIKDFFPTFNFGRVRGFFIKNVHFQLKPTIATILAQVACHKNELPQGSPCSPIISNIIGHLIDIRMVNIAKEYKCNYTRYADDLTFSTNRKLFPQEIGTLKNGSESEWEAGKTLLKEFKRINFNLNMDKTSLQTKTNRQIVTGLIVNKGINVKREYYKFARAMCDSLFKTNSFFIPKRFEKKPTSQDNSPTSDNQQVGTLNQLEGILSFIFITKVFISPKSINNKYNKDKKINGDFFNPPNFIKIYRSFLYYKLFYINDCPTLICEGKTDLIYLKCALKKLETDYSTLVNKDGSDYKFNFKCVNFSQNFQRVVSKSEGTSGIMIILKQYLNQMKCFFGGGKKNPVIVLLDNDKGAKEIKSVFSIIKSAKSFTNLFANVYIVFIPEVQHKSDNEIEDLFDNETLEKQVDGKIFNPKGKIDTKKEYGKIIFAEKVIKPNWKTINFDNFKPIFDTIEEIKRHHASV